MEKKCTKCGEKKKLTEFHEGHSGPGTYYSWCKECKNNHSKKNVFKYKDTMDKWKKEKLSDYLKATEKERLEYSQKYRKSDNFKKSRKAYNKRHKNDPIFKLKNIIYSRLNKLLKNKQQSTSKYLNCNFEELKQHIESQFLPEFNWENYGIVWEIDHIKGLANFNLSQLEEQKKAFHFTNLKPIFKTTAIAEQFGYKDQIGNRNKKKYEKNNNI